MALIAQFLWLDHYNMFWLAMLIESSLKALAILVLASLLAKALGRRSASLRHLVWSLAIACALALPALLMVIPTWQVNSLSQFGISLQFPSPPQELPLTAEGRGTSHSIKSDWNNLYSDGQSPGRAASKERTPADTTSDRRTVSGLPSAWIYAVLIGWFCGAAILLVRLISSFFGMRRICSSAAVVTDASLNDLLVNLAASMKIKRRVGLLINQSTDIPLTSGVFHPTIILPADVEEWPLDRQRVVLCHELAHVKRLDALMSLIADLARLFYWFNPLIWMAIRALRYERERACDDYVVARGEKPSEYASALLELSERLGAAECPSHVIVMAHQFRLERRVLAILDPHLLRTPISRSVVWFALIAAISLIIPLAAVRPAEARKTIIKENTELSPSSLYTDQSRVYLGDPGVEGKMDIASTMKSEMQQVIEAATSALAPSSYPERESQNLSLSSQITMEDEVARSVLPSSQILKNGKEARGYLGVLIQEVTPALAKAFKLDQARGALIGDMKEDGPAARAGLAKGDIIIELNGEQVTRSSELILKISQMAAGSPVRLKIFRDGNEREVVLKLGESPNDEMRESGSALVGVKVETLTPGPARQLNLPANTRGVVVVETRLDSAAAEAGLVIGDVIQEVDHQPVNNVTEFRRAIKRASKQPALLLVKRGGHTRFLVIRERGVF
jgi:beta-lactamase regulating signal transducer with metallopeptidase domain